MNRKELGALGETYAVQYLTAIGYKIIGRNIRPLGGLERGEIDIVAQDCNILCFIEVKVRQANYNAPNSSVTVQKRGKLVRLANAYLSVNNIEAEDTRFDVVSVWTNPSRPTPMVSLHKDAFRPD